MTISEPSPTKSPPWTWEETVLACALVERNDWKQIDDSNPIVIEMSEYLQLLPYHAPEKRADKFRNAAGVALKTRNLALYYQGRPKNNCSAMDRKVVDNYRDKPNELHSEADRIRLDVDLSLVMQITDVETSSVEGRQRLRQHLTRERDPRLRAAKIAQARNHGAICCEVCGFDFELTYGTRGSGYIECHHRTPLSESGQVETTLDMLALICSNCHRMVHRSPWITVEDLRTLLNPMTIHGQRGMKNA